MKKLQHFRDSFRVGIMFLILAGFIFPPLVLAETIDQNYQDVSNEYRAALAIPQKEQKSEALRQCIQHLQQFLEVDFGEKYADRTYYLIARCYHQLHDINHSPADLKSAIEKYRSVISRYPQSALADDAQYLTGILYESKDPAQAYIEFKKIELFYPQSDMRAKAAQKLNVLNQKLGCAGSESKKEAKDNNKASRAKENAVSAKPAGSVPSASPSCPKINRLTKIKHWSGPDYTRVALYIDNPVEFKETAIPPDPKKRESGKIYVDLENCIVNPKIKTKIPIMDSFLQDVRAQQNNSRQTRVVLNTEAIDSYRIFSMSDPFRVIVDVRGKVSENDRPAPPQVTPPTNPSVPSLAKQLALEVRRIVLDPGHGGKDKGATSPNGIHEKDITLAIAKSLKHVLEKNTDCEVILTRTRDVYLSLEERTAIANAKKADLFVSIHTNAHEDRNLYGTETYFLNLSKDAESARVAAFENATSTKKVSDLETILHDLMLNTKLNESAQLARQVQKHVVDKLKANYESIRDLGTKQAPFYVLLGAEMPSILIETAFITNEREENRLRDKRFQENLAIAISSGIQSYIQQIKGFAKAGDPS
ncbi:N-acetylmuramoyl-L-alanine amidase [Desulforhabdus amnigena]|nr:N-acetylmuramoyl-L-alanine amidase [Desulforhabdus amnigena]NLJ28697.1 AMIN domain-containing protein [Deltaproteobacteria bacterium]